MKYILVLDYAHLDNGLFLTSVAKGLAEIQQKQEPEIMVVHGESEYTERLIQTGIMRDEATVRAIKDLNHRLIALFADEGVSAVGLNGYQRECITLADGALSIDMDYFEKLHSGPILLLSNLVLDQANQAPAPVSMDRYLNFLYHKFDPEEVLLFSKYDHTSPADDDRSSNTEKAAPEDLENLSIPVKITTIKEFRNKIE